MRLIDIDALPKGRIEWEDIINAPTIDAVEVVRCGECESYVEAAYWFDDKDKRHECHICTAHSIEVNTDDYCSYGERKD